MATAHTQEHSLRQEMGLRDLVLAQVLCVVGSSWVGIAAKLGRAHVVFWIAAMLMFYLPLAAVVIHLNRLMPQEGGLYQWARAGFGEMAGFVTAWNLWVYAVVCVGAILFQIPTEISYMFGPAAAWLPASKLATLAITSTVLAGITLVAIRGLDVGKWLHNAGSVLIMLAYTILLMLPIWALWRGSLPHFEAIPWQWPKFDLFSLAVFGQMSVGALSGFEYVAILAGECRSAARTVGQSVVISAPIIALMFILGTSVVLAFIGGQPINVIGPIPQTMRAAMGNTGPAGFAAPFAIFLLIARAIASSSLIFTGLTRLPMTAGWDNLVPRWFSQLHPRWKTPRNSILFVAALVMGLVTLSMLGVHEQEANQLLVVASDVHYAIAYAGLFLIPLVGTGVLRSRLPVWLKVAAAAGLVTSLVSMFIAVYPIVDVVSRAAYATKICGVVAVSNMLGILIYRWGSRSAA
ncbi:MAG TPA: APC family permease [Candidatus Sulfopaludibacter sp.]|nr:APC family permease [Candidatus Sulfopaludibacter sp.]